MEDVWVNKVNQSAWCGCFFRVVQFSFLLEYSLTLCFARKQCGPMWCYFRVVQFDLLGNTHWIQFQPKWHKRSLTSHVNRGHSLIWDILRENLFKVGDDSKVERDDSKVERGIKRITWPPNLKSCPGTTDGDPPVKYALCPLKQHGGQRGWGI